MAEKFVTVQMFNNSLKARMAANLLENEGIESMVSGELSQDVLLGTGLEQIALQVHEDQAHRATILLAEVEAARLESDWEEQAESGAGVWICSLCGEPISNGLSCCYSCATPRDGIRAATPRDSSSIQARTNVSAASDEIQRSAKVPRDSPGIAEPVPARQETPSVDGMAGQLGWTVLLGLLAVGILFVLVFCLG